MVAITPLGKEGDDSGLAQANAYVTTMIEHTPKTFAYQRTTSAPEYSVF
jgi:hypothetical protein